MEKSAVVEHAWENHHPIDWEETTVLDHGEGQELLLKGGPAHPDDTLGATLQPGWRTGSPWLLDRCDEEAGRSNPHRPLTSDDVYPQ